MKKKSAIATTAKTKKSPDSIWLEEQVSAYVEERSHYKTYAQALRAILQAAVERFAPGAIVEGREKSVPSFVEKAVRKRDKYDNPAYQVTDLCGARAIVFTQSQVETICKFVRENFVIDEANSDDAGARLKPSEFGYRSIHFVVQLRKPSILGVRVPLTQIGERKAEIQVRTLLQHAWATITHDRLYKGTFKPSKRLERLSARLSALLEDAEAIVETFESEMQEYLGSYLAHLEPDQLEQELQIQSLVLDHEEAGKRAPVALKLARLCRAVGQFDLAISTLKSVLPKASERLRLAVDLELGASLIQRGQARTSHSDIEEGIRRLTAIARMPKSNAPIEISFDREEEKLRSEAAALIADTRARDTSRQKEAPEFFNLALQRDPSDPYHLVSLFQFRPALTEDRRVVEAARPALLRALDACRRHIEAGLELPRAWLTMARLHLLLEKPYAAVDSYCKAIYFYRTNPWKQEDFDAELNFLHQLRNKGFCGPCSWVEGLLRIGWALRNGETTNLARATGRPALHRYAKDQRVLIIAGGAAASLEPELAPYGAVLKEALESFDGAVVSGGTTNGIPGRVGAAARALRAKATVDFTLVGYHPTTMPAHVELDRVNYDTLHEVKPWGGPEETPADFSAAEPLQNWLDLLASGIDPTRVRVLGINGGDISRFEYAMALAFGATVGVVESSGRQASEICRDPDWAKVRTLLPLPLDSATLHAFVHLPPDLLVRDDSNLERMARKVHEIYLRSVKKKDYKKPATLPWEYLPEDFVFSNKAQAAYAPHILQRFGFHLKNGVRKPKQTPIPKQFAKRMAEMEHGRWNIERLLRGWRYAAKRSDEQKRSPYLVPWQLLTRDIRKYDYDAVCHFPEILAAGGYEIVKG
jgi:ppGpp synthetase/RelA/SpoT-type nucleotidyltranferase